MTKLIKFEGNLTVKNFFFVETLMFLSILVGLDETIKPFEANKVSRLPIKVSF